MCVIISKPAGVDPLKREYFENAWEHNSQGGGVVWKTPDDEVKVQKGFMNKDEFLSKLDEINTKDNSFIAHFRIKSVGEVKPENTHPFVMDKVTFAHNGTISGIKAFDGKTDSETFGLLFLKNRSMKWIKENALLLEVALGSSKFALMDNKTGEIFILNKEYGKEQDGAWFSNESAFPRPATTYSYSNYAYYHNLFKDDDLTGKCSNTILKPNKTLGTKNYQHNYAEFDKDKKCWVYSSTKQPVYCALINNNFQLNRRGLWQLANSFEPSTDFEDLDKKSVKKVAKLISQYQSLLNKKLKAYWRDNFDYQLDKQDSENEIHALNIVLNAVRRLFLAGKAISFDNLANFLFAKIPVKASRNQLEGAFDIYLQSFAEDFLTDTDETYFNMNLDL